MDWAGEEERKRKYVNILLLYIYIYIYIYKNFGNQPWRKKTIQNYSENHYLKLLKIIVTIHQC